MPKNTTKSSSELADLPRNVGGWELTEASREIETPGGNYEHPYQDRVFVNIHRPDVINKPGLWRAKYNDHLDGTEAIAISSSYQTVVDAAIQWMRKNPANSDRDGQMRLG